MTNTTTTATNLEALRNQYRALQVASGLDRDTFSYRVGSLLGEIADGERRDFSPAQKVEAAREVSYYAARRNKR